MMRMEQVNLPNKRFKTVAKPPPGDDHDRRAGAGGVSGDGDGSKGDDYPIVSNYNDFDVFDNETINELKSRDGMDEARGQGEHDFKNISLEGHDATENATSTQIDTTTVTVYNKENSNPNNPSNAITTSTKPPKSPPSSPPTIQSETTKSLLQSETTFSKTTYDNAVSKLQQSLHQIKDTTKSVLDEINDFLNVTGSVFEEYVKVEESQRNEAARLESVEPDVADSTRQFLMG